MWVLLGLAGCGGAVSAGNAADLPSDLPDATVAQDFWAHWGDGRAEIDTYSLTTPRYGELRQGSAVMIFVTEDFTDGQRVKSDGGHNDEYPVLKLNEIRHFQTGIYDYSVMTSTFLALDGRSPAGLPQKVSFSAQEWCGHVYEQLIPRSGRRGGEIEHVGHSYFDGEADHERKLPLPLDAVLADALPMVARGLLGPGGQPWPAPGAELEVQLLETLMRSRFAHQAPSWREATLSRGDRPSTVTVPAGTFEVRPFEVRAGDFVATWQIEVAPPHRIVRFTTSEGEVGELVASKRVPYWQLNREGDERHLAELGLVGASRWRGPGEPAEAAAGTEGTP